MTPAITVNETSIAIFMKGRPYTVHKTHPNWDEIIAAINEENYEALPDLISVEDKVRQQTTGSGLEFKNGTIYWGEHAIRNSATEKLLKILNEGSNPKAFTAFLEKLLQNPSKRVIDQLYEFINASLIPITPDGNIILYKKVNADFTDCHTGTITNTVGTGHEMPRSMVDDDPQHTCSHGFHGCALGYLKNFHGSRVIAIEVNPKDVVAIPYDYDNTKVRLCAYKVIAELDMEDCKDYWNKHVVDDYYKNNNDKSAPRYYTDEDEYKDEDYLYNPL